MSRTKGAYIEYAKQRANSIGYRRVLQTIPGNDDSTDGGNEASWRDLRKTTTSDDGPTSISSGVYEISNGSPGTSDEWGEDQDGGIYSQHPSSNGTPDGDSYYDIPVRNYYAGPSQNDGTGTGSGGVRVTRTRSSAIDRMASAIGSRLPKSPKKSVEQKAISITRKLLTLQEITRNKPVLIKLVLWTSENVDYGISAVTRGHRDVDIWSNLE